MASLESLERTLGRLQRHEFKVIEHKPARELVAAQDIVRRDSLGRRLVACPKGIAPPSYLTLTEEERDSLVEPPPPKRRGHMNPGHGGFTPEGVVVSEWPTDG